MLARPGSLEVSACKREECPPVGGHSRVAAAVIVKRQVSIRNRCVDLVLRHPEIGLAEQPIDRAGCEHREELAQLRADGTALARAQVGRLRLVLLKIGARITRSVRRIVLHLPRAHPDPDAWRAVAVTFGAVPG